MARRGLTIGLREHVPDNCLRQTLRIAYETQGKSYDLMELFPAQYWTSKGEFRTLLKCWLQNW